MTQQSTANSAESDQFSTNIGEMQTKLEELQKELQETHIAYQANKHKMQEILRRDREANI